MTSSQEDQQAVMSVIEAETKAFWDKDYAAWAECWAHTPFIRMLGWWEQGGITVTEGWDNLSQSIETLIKDNPIPNPTAAQVRRENVNIRITADMAWVTFDQYGLDTGDSRMDMPGLSHESRILEKYVGEWKIVYVSWLLVG